MLMTPTRLSGALFSPDGLGPTGVIRDFFQHVVAFDQFAEGGVLMVKK